MQLRDYNIGEKVFEDWIGETYLANKPGLEETVHLKILHKNLSQQKDVVEAFHKGADAAASFENEDIVKIITHDQEKGQHFIILENPNLLSLEGILKRKKILPVNEAIALVEKIASSLRRLHLDGLVYGVLTLQNIVTDANLEKVKITNFGFVDFIKTLLEKKSERLLDSLPYFSPELVKNPGWVEPQSDVYSLGVLFYRLLVGTPPWTVLNFDDFLKPRNQRTVVPPSLQRLEIPDFLDNLILEAIEPDLDDRCPNFTQFLEDITEAKSSLLAAFTPTSELLNERARLQKALAPDENSGDELFSETAAISVGRNIDLSSSELPAPDEPPAAPLNGVEIKSIDETELEVNENGHDDTLLPSPSNNGGEVSRKSEALPQLEEVTQTPANELEEPSPIEDIVQTPSEKVEEIFGPEEVFAEEDIPTPIDRPAFQKEIHAARQNFSTTRENIEPEQGGNGSPDAVINKTEVEVAPAADKQKTEKVFSIEQNEFDDKNAIRIPENGRKVYAANTEAVESAPAGYVVREKKTPVSSPSRIKNRHKEIEQTDEFTSLTDTENIVMTQISEFRKGPRKGSVFSILKIALISLLLLLVIYALAVFAFDFNLSEDLPGLFSFGKKESLGNRPPKEQMAGSTPGNDATAENVDLSQNQPVDRPKEKPINDQLVSKTDNESQKLRPAANLNQNSRPSRTITRPGRPQLSQPVVSKTFVPPPETNLEITVKNGQQPLIADIFLNGRSYGSSDNRGTITISGIKADESYIVKVQKSGFEMWAQEVTLTGSGTQRVQVNLREIIVSAPPKNVVPQNASSQKQTSRPVAPSQDRTNRPRPQPEPVDRKPDRAIINIELTNPEEISEAFIYINDTLWQGDDNIAPAQIKLPLGNYIIEVRKDGYRSTPPLYSLDVVGGESRTFSFILLPN